MVVAQQLLADPDGLAVNPPEAMRNQIGRTRPIFRPNHVKFKKWKIMQKRLGK
jgi:hypothetical protein